MAWENNHFIQKALAKNWADKNGIVKYIRDGELEINSFNINSEAKHHPISKKNFYTEEIERGMNRIESDGIAVIRKIINNSKTKEIRLTRKEVVLLRFFITLSEVRTEKLRDNYKNNDGDSLFRKINEEDGRTPQEIQEYKIKKLIDWYDAEVNNRYEGSFYQEYNEKIQPETFEFIKNNSNPKLEDLINHERKTSNIENMTLLNFSYSLMHSKICIVRFNSSNLLLMEANSYCEYYPNNKFLRYPKMYSFFPISPSLAIVFYNVDLAMFYPGYKSIIFKNDLYSIPHFPFYKNIDKMLKEVLDLEKKHNIKINGMIERNIIFKYKDDNDVYLYPYIDEDRDAASTCNGMMMVHNKDHLILFKDKNDIDEAKKMIELKRIYRLEDKV